MSVFGSIPTDIQAVFPPDASLGDHSNVLPHIVLNRSTLPWERSPGGTGDSVPWMALLLFQDDEKPTPRVVTLDQLQADAAAHVPPFTLELGQTGADQVTVIDVPRSLLEAILPSRQDLPYSAHVRQVVDANGAPAGDEMSVIFGSRLSTAGGLSTVHLVSLEGRYSGSSFDFRGASTTQTVALISLKQWSFACLDEQQSFSGLLTHLDRTPSTLQLMIAGAEGNTDAQSYLTSGYAPLPHALRQGDATVSWYHGPLLPAVDTGTAVTLPAHSSDELLRYNPALGMLDASYAAAWELGRLLALQDKRFSTTLFRWKRSIAQQRKGATQLSSDTGGAYPLRATRSIVTRDAELEPVPTVVQDWFDHLS